MNTWQFHLSNCQGLGPVSTFFVSFVYTLLLVWAFPVTQAWSLLFNTSLLLAFCFLFVCMVDQTQMCLSSISPSGLFQGIICKIERLKGGTLEPWSIGETWTVGGPNLKVGNSDLSSYHARANRSFHCHTGGPGKLIMFLTLTAFKIQVVSTFAIKCQGYFRSF